MPVETERKFLVDPEQWEQLSKPPGIRMRQGYLNLDPGRTVRLRIAGAKATLTVKGPATGASRKELECEVPAGTALEMLDEFALAEIDKIRYDIPFGRHLWEVDEFFGDNEGLLVAEIELESEEEAFDRPEWIREEVTGDSRYYNAALSLHPYKNWSV